MIGAGTLAARVRAAVLALGLLQVVSAWAAADAPLADPQHAALFASVDRVFADFVLDGPVPGLVYGVVAGGRLVHVRGFGVQDLESKRPVTPDSLFRIASMTKAFTALTVLRLRDDGKLRLDEPAERLVHELRDWKYPTLDSPRIRVRDLLNHTAGLVTDDPWGDRQTPMAEADFSALLRAGVPFSRPPGSAMEYSNLGYAILGRIISTASGRPYADEIAQTLLAPLGMGSSGFDAGAAPVDRRAQGYDWHDNTWTLEPTMAHGAFGAMGGLQTSAADYARWVGYLLSAWPARDDADAGPVRRATVRELAQGSNFPSLGTRRPNRLGQEPCKRAIAYGMGMSSTIDCDLGSTLAHSGGYPGYGSFVLLLPEQGVGLFAFANRTYAAPIGPVYEAAMLLKKADYLKDRPVAISRDLADAYRVVGDIYLQGDVGAHAEALAMNFLMDRDAAGRKREVAELKKRVGDCDTTAPVLATGALAGEFTWRCARGRLAGSLLLTPTRPPRIQSIDLAVK